MDRLAKIYEMKSDYCTIKPPQDSQWDGPVSDSKTELNANGISRQ